MPRRTRFNNKRKFRSPPTEEECVAFAAMAARVRYGGDSTHKTDAGDFELTPPTSPRQGKTLCDQYGVVERAVALRLLREGLGRGFVSTSYRGGWPHYVWTVDRESGHCFEAKLTDETRGVYKGYPIAENDPFRKSILETDPLYDCPDEN